LRFDKVATRVVERLRGALGRSVPDGRTVAVTITAPIRLAAKTTAALEERVRGLLEKGSTGRDEKAEIHGNRVRIRVLKSGSKRAAKLIGFVHNADSDPLLLLDMTRELVELLGGDGDRPSPKRAQRRWLVVTGGAGSSCLEAYRSIYSQLRAGADFEKVLMAFDDGQVGELTD
jgi:hypothetical protein